MTTEEKLERALDLLDKWREIFHNNNITVYEDGDNDTTFDLLDNTHTDTCTLLVDCERYKFEELFWTQEVLDRAREEMKELVEFLGIDRCENQ